MGNKRTRGSKSMDNSGWPPSKINFRLYETAIETDQYRTGISVFRHKEKEGTFFKLRFVIQVVLPGPARGRWQSKGHKNIGFLRVWRRVTLRSVTERASSNFFRILRAHEWERQETSERHAVKGNERNSIRCDVMTAVVMRACSAEFRPICSYVGLLFSLF